MFVRWGPPEGLDEADLAWFDSDAPTNRDAIREVDIDTMAEVEQLIAPLFTYACHPHRLPSPRVTIEFPASQLVAA